MPLISKIDWCSIVWVWYIKNETLMPTFVWFMSVVFENVCTLFLGPWTGRVHICWLFGAGASFACRGMCGIFKTDFHAIIVKGNIEWKQNVRQVSNWPGLVLRAWMRINTARAPYSSCSACPLFAWKCLLSLPFVLRVQCFWLRYQHLTRPNSPMGQRSGGMPTCINSGVPLQPFVSDTHHPCSATQRRTYYLPCRTSIAIVAHVNSQRTLSSFGDENILKKQQLVSDYQRRLSVLRWEMQWYAPHGDTHTHTPDSRLWYGNHIHWQHNRDKCIRLHSEPKVVQREADIGCTPAFLLDMHALVLS